MTIAERLVLKRQRHLKWRVLDPLETALMLMCGLLLFGREYRSFQNSPPSVVACTFERP